MTARKTHMVRVTNPNDSSQYVDVKVIDQITFLDEHESGQETTFRFNNTSNNIKRKVRVQTVTGSDGSSTVATERVLAYSVLDEHESAQEAVYRETGDQQEPPVHLKTHTVTIHNPSNSNLSLVLQRVDSIKFNDQHDSAQDTIFRLSWADDDETNPSDVDTSSDGTSINPPWRLDPFQSIIDVQWGGADMWVAGGPLAQWATGQALAWTTSTDPFTSSGVETGAAGGNGIWLLGGKDALISGSAVMEKSTDGAQTWTSISPPTGDAILDMCFGTPSGSSTGYFFVLSNTPAVFKSSDGLSWSSLSMPGADLANVTSLDFCNGSLFLGGSDNTGGPYGFHNAAIWRSDDGNSFTKTSVPTDCASAYPSYSILDPGFPSVIHDVVYDPILKIYYAVGLTSSMNYELGPVGYSIGSSGLLMTSGDGATWSQCQPNAFIPPPMPGAPSSQILCAAAGSELQSGSDKPVSVVMFGGRSSPDGSTLYKTMMRSVNGGGTVLVASSSDGTGAEVTGLGAANGAFAAAPAWASGILVSSDGGASWALAAHSMPANFIATGPASKPPSPP